jgi:hypothetical protein
LREAPSSVALRGQGRQDHVGHPLGEVVTGDEDDPGDVVRHQPHLGLVARTDEGRPAEREHRHHTLFGLTNTQIHRVSALVRLHESGQALEFAATISPRAVAALSAERQASYLLDLTEAHAGTGNHRQAVWMLGRAEQFAPEEVRRRPLAHGLLRSLLSSTTGEPAKLARQTAERAGVEV